MEPRSDSQLLQSYAESGDEGAMAEFVGRHLRLVYAAAIRGANGDRGLAEDVTQLVFTEAAKNAKRLANHPTLAGWLHKKVWHLAANFRKANLRRKNREEVFCMDQSTATPRELWENLSQSIDEALQSLPDSDREVLLLRFFEERSLREIGSWFGISDDAARMRVDRAVAKLRAHLKRKGNRLSEKSLASAMAVGCLAQAPQGLAATVAAAVLSSQTATSVSSLTLLNLITMSKIKIIGGFAALAIGIAIPLTQQHQVRELQRENTRLQEIADFSSALDTKNRQLQARNATLLKREAEARLALASVGKTPKTASPRQDQGIAFSAVEAKAKLQEVLEAAGAAPKEFANYTEMANYMNELKTRMMTDRTMKEQELAFMQNLPAHLGALEKSPKEIAEFQAVNISSRLGIQDENRIARMREILERAYFNIANDRLDLSNRPEGEAEAWKLARFFHETNGTDELLAMMSPEEQQRFRGQFRGIFDPNVGFGSRSAANYPAASNGKAFDISADELIQKGIKLEDFLTGKVSHDELIARGVALKEVENK